MRVTVPCKLPVRLFLADHLLRDRIGHHLGYNLALAEAAARAGMTVSLVTHRAFDIPLAGGVSCRRIFRTDFRAAPASWIAANHRLLTILENWCDHRFGCDLRRFPAATKSDAIFAQMLAPRHFVRWLSWLGGHPSPPVLFLHLGYRPGRFAVPGISRALECLSPGIRDRVIAVTDSEKLTGPFGRMLGTEVHYLPHVISYDIPPPEDRPASKPLVVFVPGNARREKGFAEVVTAIGTLRGSGSSGPFHFMVQRHDPDPLCAGILRRGLPSGDGIEWIDRPLSDKEYLERLGRSDVVLLPYHLDCYELRTSGIFCEARVAGKPVIASRNSWAGDRIGREGGGWLVEERDAAGLARALMSVPPEFCAKSAEARAISSGARSEFHRDAFVSGLVKLCALIPHAGN
ncbi:MAG: hypothetical protein WC003_00685 [Terrimicrobiaceae bacterium]